MMKQNQSVDLESDDEMLEASKSSICEEAISGNTDIDTIDNSDNDFGPNVTDRIVWGKPICSRRFLEVRRMVEKAWRIRHDNEIQRLSVS